MAFRASGLSKRPFYISKAPLFFFSLLTASPVLLSFSSSALACWLVPPSPNTQYQVARMDSVGEQITRPLLAHVHTQFRRRTHTHSGLLMNKLCSDSHHPHNFFRTKNKAELKRANPNGVSVKSCQWDPTSPQRQMCVTTAAIQIHVRLFQHPCWQIQANTLKVQISWVVLLGN